MGFTSDLDGADLLLSPSVYDANEAQVAIERVIHRSPLSYGYQRSRWTLQLIAALGITSR